MVRFCIFMLVAWGSGLLVSCSRGDLKPGPPTMIKVQLDWSHQAQFAGLYAAVREGYFEKENLVVQFTEGGPSVNAVAGVTNGDAVFGMASSELLSIERSKGEKVKAIAAIYRKTPRVLVALAESGIKTPKDFRGKTISVGVGGEALLEAMTVNAGVLRSDYTLVRSGKDLSDFYSGKVQVRSVYLTNEVLSLRAEGRKLNLFFPDDYRIHFYGDVLFTTDEEVAAHPEQVLGFLRAALKGWDYVLENPNQVADLVKLYRPSADSGHEAAFLEASLPLIDTGVDHIGWMNAEVWEELETFQEKGQLLTQSYDSTEVFTTDFLEKIYR